MCRRSVIPYCLLLCIIGQVHSTLDRIIGGNEVTIHNIPWQVSIQLDGRHVCGGAIYSKDIVITAAHCVANTSASTLSVRVGSNYHDGGGTLMPVAACKLHELYQPQLKPYDIALVRLAAQLKYSLSVKAIGLGTVSPTSGSSVTVSGWGYLDPAGKEGFAQSLQLVPLQIIERQECASAKYGYGWDFVGVEMICAAAGNRDACNGDSGGPMVYSKLLAGIVAWGYGCAQANYPGVYVDIAVLRSWIINASNYV